MTEHSDPYAFYRWLRDEAPVYLDPATGIWALSRFDDVRAASRDWEAFSNADGVDLDELGRRVFGPGDFLDMDPPEHDDLRAVVRSRFAPKSVRSLEDTIRAHVDILLTGFGRSYSFDATRAFAWPLPVAVMSSLFGFSEGERSEMGSLYRTVMARSGYDLTIPRAALDAAAVMRRRFVEMAHDRRSRPRDDLMTQVALADVHGARLTDRKLAGMCFVLFSAGIDTVAAVLANALWLLALHGDQLDLIVEEPDRLPAAIEEVLRYESPLQFNARTTTRDTAVGDRVIPAGARVLLLYGAANRDERRFDDPDRFDVAREPQRHLAFGEGIHFCIGAPLARLQTRIALESLLPRLPNLSLAGPVKRLPAYNMRALACLPLRAEVLDDMR